MQPFYQMSYEIIAALGTVFFNGMEFIMQKQSKFKTSSFYRGDAAALPNQVSNEATSSEDSTSVLEDYFKLLKWPLRPRIRSKHYFLNST